MMSARTGLGKKPVGTGDGNQGIRQDTCKLLLLLLLAPGGLAGRLLSARL